MKILLTLTLLFTSPLALSICQYDCFDDHSDLQREWERGRDQLEHDLMRSDIDAIKTREFEREIQTYMQPKNNFNNDPYDYRY